ncbi:MAG: efflux RND transporter periplasmic adaptor subunit [Roseibium sp.]|nr:efflux RND transporter periplasmic adaptor subunit [Roseibium sp.]
MKRVILLFLSVMVLAGAAIYISDLEDKADVSQLPGSPPLRPVSVTSASIGSYAGTVSVFAEVKPRWQIDLRSRVAGIVGSMDPRALAGARVKRGAVLLELEAAHYEAGLEEAKFALKNAEFELLKKQKKRDIALKDWRAVRPNVEPPDLAIHLPDVRVAEQSVAAAGARVRAADYDVNSAVIRAPFDAIITNRSVSPGQSVNEGDVLFSLIDAGKLDIRVSLSPREWALLAPDWRSGTARLFSETGDAIGSAHLRRGGGFLDPESRRYQVFLEVEAAEADTVLPGQFVRVELPGKSLAGTLRIPESALTQNGYVWFVDLDDRLQRFEASALFRSNGEVVVFPPDVLREAKRLDIVTLPMNSYLPGQMVSVIETGERK